MGQQSWTTPGSYTWTVPSNVSEIDVEVRGGEGGRGTRGTDRGGKGGVVSGVLPVTPGETLNIQVGGQGEDGAYNTDAQGGYPDGGNGIFNDTVGRTSSGAGGGSSDIRQGGSTLSDRVVVAGGGGGAGSGYGDQDQGGGRGGGGGGSAEPGYPYDNASGGTGGGSSSNMGENAVTDSQNGNAASSGAGGGGANGGETGEALANSGAGRAGGGGGGDGMSSALSGASVSVDANSGDGSVTITYPETPTGVSTTDVDYRSAGVTWGSDGADSYNVYRDGTQVASGITGTSYDDTGLSPDTSYNWYVTGVWSGSESDPSSTVSATTGGTAPSGVSASASSDDITITWTDTNSDEDGYEIHRSQSSGVDTSGPAVTTTAANATSYTDTSLLDGEKYYYRVVAVRDGERGIDSTEVSATTALPAPSDVTSTLI